MDDGNEQLEAHQTDPDEPPLWETVKGDFANSGGWKILGIALLMAWMAFQWGPGNDIILAPLAATTYDTIDDGSSWSIGVASVVATGVVSGLFWGVTQTLDAVIVLSGLRLIPGLTSRLGRSLKRRGMITAYADMKWSTRWILAYGAGVSILGLVDVFATERPGLGGRRNMLVASVALAAGSVAAIVSLVATAPMIATRYPSTQDEADTFVRYARNPLVWLAIFGTIFVVERLRARNKPGPADGPGLSPTTPEA